MRQSTLWYVKMLPIFLGGAVGHARLIDANWDLVYFFCFHRGDPMAGVVSAGAIGDVDSLRWGPSDDMLGGSRHDLVHLYPL